MSDDAPSHVLEVFGDWSDKAPSLGELPPAGMATIKFLSGDDSVEFTPEVKRAVRKQFMVLAKWRDVARAQLTHAVTELRELSIEVPQDIPEDDRYWSGYHAGKADAYGRGAQIVQNVDNVAFAEAQEEGRRK